MHKLFVVGFAVVCTVLPMAHVANAQGVRSGGDSVVSQVLHRDSLSRLTLTRRGIVFEYTSAGVDAARRRADSTTSAYSDRGMASLVSTSITGAFRGMRLEYSIASISGAEAIGGTVLITLKSTGRSSSDPANDRFDFDAVDAVTAQSFVSHLNELLSARH